jgi:hypothetical protein
MTTRRPDIDQPRLSRSVARLTNTDADDYDYSAGTVARAVDGRYWRFWECRIEEPLLPPGTGWMQGAAGIAAFLLRLERVLADGSTAPIVDRPDNWFAVPQHLRLTIQ